MYYSQSEEDSYLNEKYFKNMPNGVFVEVGALDGQLYSNTKYFEETHNWTGVLVEPNPVQFELLQKNRPNCKVYRDLVSDSTEPLEYRYFLTGHAAVSGVSNTLPQKHLDDYFNSTNEWVNEQPQNTESLVPRTLTDIVKDSGLQRIDLLSVDVEGHEANVLKSFDFSVPVYMVLVDVESDDSELAKSCHEVLEPKGFVLVENYKGNNVYVNRNVRLDNTHLTKPLYEANYDVVYLVGMHDNQFNPIVAMLMDESFRAVSRLSEEWVKKGKKVVVCGNFEEELVVNDVTYLNWGKFPKDKHVEVLVAWRTVGLRALLNGEFSADKLIVDFHDNFPYSLENVDKEQLNQLFNSVSSFNFKSIYHKKCFDEYRGEELASNRFNVIMSGVESELYTPKDDVKREPYRFCYYASYHKGLDVLLEKVWPFIHANEPRAELHVYGGMDNIPDENYRTKLRFLLGSPGVMDHGRQPLVLVAQEKHRSTFHLHINNLVDEVDALTVRESLKAGCIPLISKFGVFAERHGLQFDWDPSNNDLCASIARDILQRMHDEKFVEDARNQVMGSNITASWEVVSQQWLDSF
jgi:FkbM family methyltransferase